MSLPFDQMTLINFYISSYREVFPVIERPQALRSSTQMLRSSLISSFKYFVIIKFSKFCKKEKFSHGTTMDIML